MLAGAANAQSPSLSPVGSDTVYVAMGDSFAAGAGIEPVITSALCGRSAVNYAALLAEQLGAAQYRDVTCGGAKAADFAAPRVGYDGDTAAPQYDALSADTTLVTVGVGGNDIGLLSLGVRCFSAWQAVGYSCAAANSTPGADEYANKINQYANTYGQVIEEIRSRSPRATIVMVGYPTGLRPGGCPDTQPILPADADYFQARIEQLNTVMADQAAEHGALFADLIESTRGHDACASSDQRWMEGLIPEKPATSPMHPNAKSHENTARVLLHLLQGQG